MQWESTRLEYTGSIDVAKRLTNLQHYIVCGKNCEGTENYIEKESKRSQAPLCYRYSSSCKSSLNHTR